MIYLLALAKFRTPGPAVKLEFDVPSQQICVKDHYEMLLTVRAKDEDGNPYFRESSLVRFCLEGDAQIIAVDNGNLLESDAYDEEFIHMYHGCASVLVRLHANSGRVAVMADAEGMFSAAAIINIVE